MDVATISINRSCYGRKTDLNEKCYMGSWAWANRITKSNNADFLLLLVSCFAFSASQTRRPWSYLHKVVFLTKYVIVFITNGGCYLPESHFSGLINNTYYVKGFWIAFPSVTYYVGPVQGTKKAPGCFVTSVWTRFWYFKSRKYTIFTLPHISNCL